MLSYQEGIQENTGLVEEEESGQHQNKLTTVLKRGGQKTLASDLNCWKTTEIVWP